MPMDGNKGVVAAQGQMASVVMRDVALNPTRRRLRHIHQDEILVGLWKDIEGPRYPVTIDGRRLLLCL